MLAATSAFQKRKPGFSIRVGVMHFSSDVWSVLPIQPYDHAKVVGALNRIPAPGGGTAIGKAMLRAREELYRGGAYRKYMVVVTDGENGSGPDPGQVARQIHQRSEGAVQFFFVAFDTDPKKFGFLGEVGGEVVRARNAKELELALKDIYEGKILAEADYGETELYDPRKPRKKGTPR
jgi:Mg-chelatase subunit ChlD